MLEKITFSYRQILAITLILIGITFFINGIGPTLFLFVIPIIAFHALIVVALHYVDKDASEKNQILFGLINIIAGNIQFIVFLSMLALIISFFKDPKLDLFVLSLILLVIIIALYFTTTFIIKLVFKDQLKNISIKKQSLKIQVETIVWYYLFLNVIFLIFL